MPDCSESAGHRSGQMALVEPVREHRIHRFRPVSVIPVRSAQPLAHARVLVSGSDVQPDRPDQDVIHWEDDSKVDERPGCDLFHSGKALHVRGVAQLKRSEQEPICSEGGDCRHGLDETTEGGGLTISSLL